MTPSLVEQCGPFPESNANAVVRDLVIQSKDLDGTGLVKLVQTLLARTEEITSILGHSARTSQAMLSGEVILSQQLVNAQLNDTLYQTTCLKWFLACACKKLAEDLEYEVYQKQGRFPKIQRVHYTAEGEVESFKLETGV